MAVWTEVWLLLLLGLVRGDDDSDMSETKSSPPMDEDKTSMAKDTLWCDVGPFIGIVVVFSILGACCIQFAKCFFCSMCRKKYKTQDLESAQSHTTYIDEVRYRSFPESQRSRQGPKPNPRPDNKEKERGDKEKESGGKKRRHRRPQQQKPQQQQRDKKPDEGGDNLKPNRRNNEERVNTPVQQEPPPQTCVVVDVHEISPATEAQRQP